MIDTTDAAGRKRDPVYFCDDMMVRVDAAPPTSKKGVYATDERRVV